MGLQVERRGHACASRPDCAGERYDPRVSGCVAMSFDVTAVISCTGLTMKRCCVALLTPGNGLAAASILVQRRDQPGGIARELDRCRVGQIFALARHRQLHHLRRERREDRDYDQHDDQDAATAVALLVAVAAPVEAAPLQRAQDHVGHQRDQPDRDADDGHVARVEIGDVAHLVADHALQLVAVERGQQAACRHDRGIVRRGAGGEGVERVGVHHDRAWASARRPRSTSPRPR